MKSVNWRVKAVYLLIAAVLAIGLMPGLVLQRPTANAGEAFITIDGPSYTKVTSIVTFTATCTPAADSIDWSSDGTPATGSGLSYTTAFGSAGPHDVTAMGHWGTLTQTDTWTIMVGTGLIPQIAWNVIGSEETFVVPDGYNGHVTLWTLLAAHMGGGNVAVIAGGNKAVAPMYDSITVQAATYGEVLIRADTNADLDGVPGNDTLYAVKKWGKIDDTILQHWVDSNNDGWIEPGEWVDGSGSTMVTWDEGHKLWWGYGELQEQVIGTFMRDGHSTPDLEHPADGAIVYWYLLSADAPVHNLPQSEAEAIADRTTGNTGLLDQLDAMQALYAPKHTVFTKGTSINGRICVTTVSGDGNADLNGNGIIDDSEMGITQNELSASAEEAVKVVVVATYPNDVGGPQWPVFAEITSWNFWTQQLEKVPQVRWAGEEIVLEKYFGTDYNGNEVDFALEGKSPGALEKVGYAGDRVEGSTIVTHIINGTARCILGSEEPGEADVTALLYSNSTGNMTLINKHGFVVYFLKLESVTLGNVEGERVDNPLTNAIEGHDSGIWSPENPWNATAESNTTQTGQLNVSQDALLRAQVKGWFMGDDLSWRQVGITDNNNDGYPDVGTVVRPAGRWVLPDDWAYLAGPRWQELRPHWDIMDQPNDNVWSNPDGYRYWDSLNQEWVITDEADKVQALGDYRWWQTDADGVAWPLQDVAEEPVIGPYNSLDTYTPPVNAPLLDRKTIVPNGELNWWDCPMPPAKVVFEIDSGLGYFKAVDKGDVYYLLVNNHGGSIGGNNTIVYTAPFYAEMIPASPLIPPFVNNGGYDWNSFGFDNSVADGPYFFWQFINQPDQGVMPSDPQHPTKVEVYSDNHGEAMVWFNGDWNLDTIGPNPSNPLWKQWTDALSADPTTPVVVGNSTVVAIADYPYLRKHQAVESNNVTKTWTWGKEKHIYVFQLPDLNPPAGQTVNNYKLVTVWLSDRDGMPAVGEQIAWRLDGLGLINGLLTDGVIAADGKSAVSVARLPTPEEMAKWDMATGNRTPCPCAVAGVMVWLSPSSAGNETTLYLTMTEREGLLQHPENLDFNVASPEDPQLYAGLNSGVYLGPDQSVESAISLISNQVVAIWWQDGAGVWHAYVPGAAVDWASDLAVIQHGNKYWVNVKQDCMWNWGLY